MAVEDDIAFELALRLQHEMRLRRRLQAALREIEREAVAHASKLRAIARKALAEDSTAWTRPRKR